MRVLPDNLRDLLKQPIGKLVDEDELIKILENEKQIVAVGDQVTYTLLKYNIKPSFCVVDYKTNRGAFPLEFIQIIKSYGDEIITIKNPQGCITDELWAAIENALLNIEYNVTTRIEVDGEEDLASLVVLYLASRDVTLIYGLPNKGVLVVKPTNEIKNKVKHVFDKM